MHSYLHRLLLRHRLQPSIHSTTTHNLRRLRFLRRLPLLIRSRKMINPLLLQVRSRKLMQLRFRWEIFSTSHLQRMVCPPYLLHLPSTRSTVRQTIKTTTKAEGKSGSPAGIRTPTESTKNSCATITPPGYARKL